MPSFPQINVPDAPPPTVQATSAPAPTAVVAVVPQAVVSVCVPPTARAGTVLHVQTPGGGLVAVTVPAGAGPGTTLQITMPQAQAAACAAVPHAQRVEEVSEEEALQLVEAQIASEMAGDELAGAPQRRGFSFGSAPPQASAAPQKRSMAL